MDRYRNDPDADAFGFVSAEGRDVAEQEDEIVVTKSGRLAGCRGRVLLALIVLAILLLALAAMLVRGMLSGTAPQPARRAAADAPPAVEAGLHQHAALPAHRREA